MAKGEFGKYDNFFNDILEPLFYESLAVKRDADDWCKRFNCRIPFLNGGLFEPIGDYDWHKTDIVIPNRLFTNNEPVEEGITGTGVFDVFDRYNFTVNEAEPLEKEVAIDPEMLGKVFEGLLEERRKGLGAFYTPREIVHYMCQESLINYLDTAINMHEESVVPEKPQQGKMFDAPDPQQKTLKMTAHKEIVPRADIEMFVHLGEQISHYESVPTEYRIKMPKSIEQNARLIDEALANITVCDPAVGSGAFPVGMMTEIVRARLALNSYLGDKKRTPYDFKRHAIQNCLYGVDIDAGAVEIAKLRLWLSLVVDEEDVREIKPLPNLDYKIVAGNSLYGFPFRSQGLAVIEETKKKYFDESDHERKAALKAEIDKQIRKRLDDSVKALGYRVLFDFQLYFSEIFERKGGFDIVIGNPPYLNVELVSRADKDYYVQTYRTFYKRFDVFGLFFELGLTRLVRNGTVAFIVPQQIFNNLSYSKLRHMILSNQWLDQVLYLGDKIFESANNDVCVLFLRKPSVERIRLVNALDFEHRTASDVPTDYFEKFNEVISFSDDSSAHGLFDKIFDSKHERVKDRFDVFQGIVTGSNEAFILTPDQVREARIEKTLLHPILLGRDFGKWMIRSLERQIIYVVGATDIQKYPNTLKYLQQFKSALVNSRSAGEKSTDWYCLHRPRVKAELDLTPKILVQGTRNPRLKTRIVATMDEVGIYGTQGMNFIIPREKSAPLYFLLAILNSSLINYLYATKFLNVAIKAEYLKDTPIPQATNAQEKELTALAQKILAARKRDPKADTSALEREIDVLVYQLYGLTAEEIKVVEGR